MKITLLLFVITFVHVSCYGQSKNDDYKKLIDSAIIIQTTQADKTPYQPGIYLIDAKDQAYVFTSDVDQKRFGHINVYDKKNKKLLKDGIKAWKVLPVLNGSKLIVSIIDFYITYKKNNYNFANGGGATVIFEYSCDKNAWIFRETKWTGI